MLNNSIAQLSFYPSSKRAAPNTNYDSDVKEAQSKNRKQFIKREITAMHQIEVGEELDWSGGWEEVVGGALGSLNVDF